MQDSARRRSGAYAVEMALALPVLFLIIFSGFELMHFFKVRHTVNQAAYAAARQLVVPGGNISQATNAANQIARVNLLQVDGITVTPERITRDTRFVTVQINVRFLNQWSVARLFAGQSIIGRCTLAHENRSIYVD
jgi:Flp pilus assembly protein TadG